MWYGINSYLEDSCCSSTRHFFFCEFRKSGKNARNVSKIGIAMEHDSRLSRCCSIQKSSDTETMFVTISKPLDDEEMRAQKT
jgi:hypothetical protein